MVLELLDRRFFINSPVPVDLFKPIACTMKEIVAVIGRTM
jgi:hypothetical protein